MISESTAHVPFRLFSPPDVQAGAAVALGRNHASWFLVLARPEELCPSRPIFCLNFALPDDRSAFDARSAGGKHVFAVGGAMSDDIMDHLTALLDQEGCAPVNVVEVYPNNPFYLRALVEVLVPDRELMYACARCGKWETQLGPRFMRCGGCRRRCYCSTKVRSCVQLCS
ncbi:hypothetical protein OH76DRAFT_1400743 [Lentinus brumalis]|uniref:Uncharacterized protein n=1 Tax=Lentinus brumalis TaxID=2498619 RepID=A0A371DIK4_9APHY|nr:hypothetical protein OH76DRAFT_1400743 [Polyporus brumalis]